MTKINEKDLRMLFGTSEWQDYRYGVRETINAFRLDQLLYIALDFDRVLKAMPCMPQVGDQWLEMMQRNGLYLIYER